MLENPLRAVRDRRRRRRRIAEVRRRHLAPVDLAGCDRSRYFDEVSGERRHRFRDVAVVVDRRRVGDERIELAVVVPDVGSARGVVEVELRCGSVEGVVAREDDRTPVARDADRVLVVVPTHPVDRLVRAASHVVGDDDAGLLGAGLREKHSGRRRPVPGVLLTQDDVTRLLVREQELALEAVLRADEEVRAEALVPGALRDHVLALEHTRALLVQAQLAHGRVDVILPQGRKRHEGCLVVHEDVSRTFAVDPLDRDPVR